jgi:hypothetical protein
MKFKRFICRGCLQSKESKLAVKDGFCSESCIKLRRFSGDHCDTHYEFDIVPVTFHNGTTHFRKVCLDCGKSKKDDTYVTADQALLDTEKRDLAWLKT